MAIIIGMKTNQGAILASDSLLDCDWGKKQATIIQHALYSKTKDAEPISGIYYGATCGPPNTVDFAELNKKYFSTVPNLADLLTHGSLRKPKLNERQPDYFEMRLLQEEAPHQQKPEDKAISDNIHYVKSFISSSNQGKGNDLSRVVLRISENYAPSILHIYEENVSEVPYVLIGRGVYDISQKLSDKLTSIPSTNVALNIIADVMNTALTDNGIHRGYQLVIAERIPAGVTKVRTAMNLDSGEINLSELSYLGPRFEAVQASQKDLTLN